MFHKRLLQEFGENKGKVIGMVATQWGMLMANVVLMWQVALFVEALAAGADVSAQAMRVVIALAAALIIRGVLTGVNVRLSFEASDRVKTRLRAMVYEKLMRLGSRYHGEFQTSEVVQLSTEGVEQLEIYFGKYVPQFFYSMLAPLTLFVIVAGMSVKVAIVLLLCVPLIPMSIVAVQKFAKKLLAKYWGTYTQMGDSFLECLQGLTTLKIYQADERYAQKMDKEAETFRRVTMRVLIMQLNSISIMDLVAYGGAAVGAILGILEYRGGRISLAECFFILMISAEFFLPLRLLGSLFHIAMNGNAAADKIFRLLDLPEEAETSHESHTLTDLTIDAQAVTFSYTEDKEVLHNVSVTAHKGLTALVGESGCGKSTLVSLFMKEHEPQAGTMTLGGHPLTEYSEQELYRIVTRIRHDSYLFAGTIRDNLRMAKPDATDEEMRAVLVRVQLPDLELDDVIQERSANLSGGQRQRLALARALLHDTPFYIFDEATSNVDVESENAIMDVVRELARTKTVLLISHRLVNVVTADRIYVLSGGALTGAGTHEELMRSCEPYAALYRAQRELETFGKEAL